MEPVRTDDAARSDLPASHLPASHLPASHLVVHHEQAGFVRRNWVKLALSALITACLLYAIAKEDMSLVPSMDKFHHVRWWTVPGYLAMLFVLTYFRAVRWRYLLRSFADVPKGRLLRLSLIGFAAILILPFRIGEFVRPMMLKKDIKISMSAATGTIVAERIVDGLVVSVVLALALVFLPTIDPLPETVVGLSSVKMSLVRGSGFTMLAVFGIAFTTIAVFYFARDFARRATLAVFGVFSKKLAEKLAGMASGLADGLHFLQRGRDALPFLLETGCYWVLNGLGMWFLAWGCGVVHADGTPIRIAEGFAMMGMLGATVLIPGPPGLLGLFHVGIYCGMSLFFPADVVEGPGAVYTFLLYGIQGLFTTLTGAVCLLDPRARAELASANHAGVEVS